MISTPTPSEVESPQFDILQKSADELCPADADMPVGIVAQSYIDDLCLIAHDEACFFTAMGEVTLQRIEGGIA